MDKKTALAGLAALGQESRLDIFRLLVATGPEGLPAGEIAARLGLLPNTLSNHLSVLDHAGLVRGTRNGRSIRYRAEAEAIRALIGFLMQDCCGGRPELCQPVLAGIACGCAAPGCG